MDLEQKVAQYHGAADAFATGNPEPVKALWSRREDVTLANPFGPTVRGWTSVSQALDFASSRFSDGEVTQVELIAKYATTDLATIVETERWRVRLGDSSDVAPFELRVTSTFRLEDEDWMLVHRHADAIATSDPRGPF